MYRQIRYENDIYYRFDIDNAICRADIAADMETTKIRWDWAAEITSFDVG